MLSQGGIGLGTGLGAPEFLTINVVVALLSVVILLSPAAKDVSVDTDSRAGALVSPPPHEPPRLGRAAARAARTLRPLRPSGSALSVPRTDSPCRAHVRAPGGSRRTTRRRWAATNRARQQSAESETAVERAESEGLQRPDACWSGGPWAGAG